ncbi:MAG TPA: hypothetical protein PKC69_08900 [Chitinophagaceae bacterium]|nr:hypothetical protein [Chitinophagaceae bacterium]
MSRGFAGVVRFFVYSNLFICCCAVLMTWQALYLFSASADVPALYGFVFAGTLCSYSFHWWLTPAGSAECSGDRGGWVSRYRPIHLFLLFAGLAGSIVFLFALYEHAHWLVVAALITFLYSAPKIPHPFFIILQRIAIGKTFFLSLMWTFVTSVLPLLVTDTPWEIRSLFFAISRFFLVYAICVLFDFRDREQDKASRIRSLITYFSPQAVFRLFIFSLLLYAIFCLLPGAGLSSRLMLFQLLPAMLLLALYRYSIEKGGDLFYYLFLDGLMAASAALLLADVLL